MPAAKKLIEVALPLDAINQARSLAKTHVWPPLSK